jgi:aryl carrier-like protein
MESSRLETAILPIFGDVLRRSQVARDDDFFVLGGDSLLLTTLVTRIRAALGVPVTLMTLAETGEVSVASLAASIAADPDLRAALIERGLMDETA